MYYHINGDVIGAFSEPQEFPTVFIETPRPSIYHFPVFEDGEFIEWQYQFSEEQVAEYRDSKILDVELTVNMPDESEVVIVNNLRTIAAIDSKMKSMDAESSIETVKFEFSNGVRDTTYADFQQVMFARERFEQRAFAAYFTILENHQSTPYTDEQSWKDDFDMEWEE